jgi:hypothetical protein
MEIAFDVRGNEVRHVTEIQGRRWEQRFALPAAPTAVRLDPDGWVLKVVQ